ncbi:MAG: restriction endonuclease subunit S [Bifidobacteriaceae bacterium]|jgi:type I restriction enzyme S subunit|nr:restriction endonuclease subunit S [Bifidobacteriaceae bacterium]
MGIVKLGDVGKIVTGKTPSTKNAEYFGSDFMFITPDDIANNPSSITASKRYISEAGLNAIKANSIDGESVVVGCVGDIGTVGYVNEKCATNQQINSVTKIRPEFSAKFIYYRLMLLKDYLRSQAGQTVLPILPKSTFARIEIKIPPLPAQQSTARVLSALDDKITLNNKINAELEKMARLIYDYWFVQFNFPDKNNRPLLHYVFGWLRLGVWCG